MTASLLASVRTAAGYDVGGVILRDPPRRGAVAVRARPGLARRAEPGPAGPLILEARSTGGEVVCEVWGPARTPRPAVDRAVEEAIGWVGLRDEPQHLAAVVEAHPVARRLVREIGEVRLSRLPRVGESVARAVLSQLVQGVEARRTIMAVAASAGSAAPGRLWAWPTAAQLGAVPAATLRRCGVSLRGARSLHAAAVEDARLSAAVGDWPLLDRRLRSLPGIGAWTAAETRLALGDPDAVSLGDYNLPALVGGVLTGRATSRSEGVFDDAAMLELLAPFAGQRGRVIRLCELAAPAPLRRGPRAAISAHRYW